MYVFIEKSFLIFIVAIRETGNNISVQSMSYAFFVNMKIMHNLYSYNTEYTAATKCL